MEALSFSRARHRWQLQLPGKQKQSETRLEVMESRSNLADTRRPLAGVLVTFLQLSQLYLTTSSEFATLCCRVSAYPLVVQSWVELDSTCGSLDHSHHRKAAGPTNTQNFNLLMKRSPLTLFTLLTLGI